MGELQKRIMKEIDDAFHYSIKEGVKTFQVPEKSYVEAMIRNVVEEAKYEFPINWAGYRDWGGFEVASQQKLKEWFEKWFL